MTAKLKVPTDSAGLQELLSDPAQIREFFSPAAVANGDTKAFLDAYASDYTRRNPDTQDDLRTQVQSVMFDMLREGGAGRKPLLDLGAVVNGHGRPVLTANGTAAVAKGKGTVYNRLAPGHALSEKLEGGEAMASIGEYLQAIRVDRVGATNSAQQELLAKLNAVRRFQDSFGSEDPGAGGFLIPEIMRSELLQLAIEESLVRSRATVIPMSTLRVPIPTVDDTSHASSLFGGVVFSWTEESGQLAESQAKFGKVALDAKKLTGFFRVPSELLADAPAFSGWFDNRIPMGLAWSEDLAFLAGPGGGEPLGVIGAQNPAYTAITRTASGNDIEYADIVAMYARMLPTSLRNAVWVASIDSFPDLAQMSLTSPGVWMGGYNVPGIADAPPVNIFGRPVYFTEKVPAKGNSGDISFVDLGYYLIGDRQAVAVQASEHAFFQNDQVAYRIIERVDGQPWVKSALTPHNGGATLSPYVGLADA